MLLLIYVQIASFKADTIKEENKVKEKKKWNKIQNENKTNFDLVFSL